MTIMNKSTLLFNKYKDGLSRGLKQDYNEDSREFRGFVFVNSNKPTVTEPRDIFKNNTEDEDNKVVLENPFYLKYLKNPTKNTIVLAINKVITDEPEKFNEIIVEVGSLYNNLLTHSEGKHEYADIMMEMLENSHDISTKQNIIDVFSNGIAQNNTSNIITGSENAFSTLIKYHSKFREFFINNSNDIYVPLEEQTRNGINAYIRIKNIIDKNTNEQLLEEKNLNDFLNEYQILQDTRISSYDFAKEIFEQSKIKNIKPALSKAYDDFIFERIEEKYLKNNNEYYNYNILVERVLNDDLHNGFDELKNFVNKLEQHLLDNYDKIRTTVMFDLYDFLKKKYIVREVEGKRESFNLINPAPDETYHTTGLIQRKVFLDLLTRKPFEYREDYFELKLAKEFYHELVGNEDFANKIIEQSGFTYVYNEDEDFYQPEDLKLTLAYIKNPTDDMIIKALDKCSYNIIYVINDTDKLEIKQHKTELLFDYLRNINNKDENSNESKFSLEKLYMTGGIIYGSNEEYGEERLLLRHTEISKLNKILDELPIDIKAQAIRETVNMDFMKIKSHEFHNNEIIDAFYDNSKAIAYVDLYVNHQSLTEQYVYERHEREARSDNNFNWRTALIQPNTEPCLGFGNSKVNKFDDVYQIRFIEKIKEYISNNNIEKDFEYYKTTQLLKHISFKNIDNEFIEKCLSVSKPEIILETLSNKYEEHNGKRKYFELSDEQQKMIFNKSFDLVHYINNPSLNTLLKMAEISFNPFTLDKDKDEYSKLNELIINELKRYDYKDGTMNHFVDVVVVDFPPEYTIHFMKEIETNSNYSEKEKNKIIKQCLNSAIENANTEILNEFKDRLEIEETKEKTTEFTINLKM